MILGHQYFYNYLYLVVSVMASKQMIKSQIIAIAYSAVIKQIFKVSKSNTQSNRKLFNLGEEIGFRVSDQIIERQTNSYKPDEVAGTFLKSALREYMGCEITVLNPELSYQKTKFSIKFRVSIKENPLCDFIVVGRGQARQSEDDQNLNYHGIIMGFISGCLKSMAYYPTVTLVSDSLFNENYEMTTSMILAGKLETVFDVDMWKEKQDD